MFLFVDRDTREIIALAESTPEGIDKGSVDVYQANDQHVRDLAELDAFESLEHVCCFSSDGVIIRYSLDVEDDDEPEATEESEIVPELIPIQEPELVSCDLSILDLSVPKLRKALEEIDDINHLSALVAAEQDGKTRKGALAALSERIDALEI